MANTIEKIYELIKTMPEERASEVLTFAENLQQKAKTELQRSAKDDTLKEPRHLLAEYAGILKESPNFNGDPMEIQRRLRDEWS